MTKQFHMPILRGQIFEGHTMKAIQAFLASKPRGAFGSEICALRVDFSIDHRDHELVIMDARLTLYGLHADGYFVQNDPLAFTGDLRTRYNALAGAITTDGLAVQNVGMGDFLPWQNDELRDDMLGKLFSCVQTPHFALLGAEYPSSPLADYEALMLGPDASEEWRRRLMSLILPKQPSAHAAMAEMARFPEIETLVRALWDNLLDGQGDTYPLAKLEPPSSQE